MILRKTVSGLGARMFCKTSQKSDIFVIQRSTKTKYIIKKDKNFLKADIKKHLRNFVALTTIPGIVQLASNPRLISKFLWILALTGGVVLTIFQSKSLYDDFYQRKTVQVHNWEFFHLVEFPAVTVCTHNPFVNWPKAVEENHQIVSNTLKAVRKYDSRDDRDNYIERVLMNEMNKIGQNERYRLGIQMEEFIVQCIWEDSDCKGQLLKFNNLYYGNCFTFNHGLNGSAKLKGATSSVLSLVMKINSTAQFPHIFRDNGVAVLIHSPETAPVLQFDSVAIVYPGYRAQFYVSEKLIERLAAPYPSMCIDTAQAEAHRKTGYYYTNERPYSYSSEACMRSCLQRLNIESCHCITETKTPFDILYSDAHKLQNVSVCPIDVCEPISPVSVMKHCECPQPCKELIFEYKYSSDRQWIHSKAWKDLFDRISTTAEKGEDIVVGEISFGTSYVETIKEEPFISEATFLSNIGGNIGLCLGISLLSVVEVLELCFFIVKESCLLWCLKAMGKYQKRFRKKTWPIANNLN